MLKRLLFITCCVVPVPSFSTVNCNAILEHGLRNIRITKGAEAAIATNYFNHCNKDFSSMSDDQVAHVSVEVFGSGGGSASFTRKQREERLKDWCKTEAQTANSNKAKYEESRTMFGAAVTAWDNCNKLASEDVQIVPGIDDAASSLEISIRYTGSSEGVKFYGLEIENFSCTLKVPGEERFTIDGSNKLPKNFEKIVEQQAIAASCKRSAATKQVENGQTYEIKPKGKVVVQTASTNVPFYFPEEYTPTLPTQKAQELENKIRALQKEKKALDSLVSTLQKELTKIRGDVDSEKGKSEASIKELKDGKRGEKVKTVKKVYKEVGQIFDSFCVEANDGHARCIGLIHKKCHEDGFVTGVLVSHSIQNDGTIVANCIK